MVKNQVSDCAGPDHRVGLQVRLQQAHENCDPAALSDLYTEAADHFDARGDIDAACFYLTQALVYALEAGSISSIDLRARLRAWQRI